MADETQTDNKADEKQELPDWAREQISEANKQAARYRTEKKDAVEAARQEVRESFEGKISELEAQIESGKNETQVARHEAEKLRVTIQAGIDADKALAFADLLKGDDEESLLNHATELKKLFTTEDKQVNKQPATDPTQSSGSGSAALNGDPILRAVMSRLK